VPRDPITVAALFVDPRGPYFNIPFVDCWPETRDARLYAGPYPVIAHPPCGRWCRLAKFVEYQTEGRLAVGDDHGCFASALASVRKWSGVLEHPAWSLAWAAHGLIAPPARGWQRNTDGDWCCEVAQSAYGHQARKLTWLYYVGLSAPACLDWTQPSGSKVISGMRNHCARPLTERLWTAADWRRAGGGATTRTPDAFAEVLVALARGTAA
jgi:hypothetical protein